ncbi:MAG: 3-hydroxyacyl-[acyl-carrier-protein] dehydratase FabZ [Candidatus Fraserbacteria bacterium RBG_16_55_9]|uniref:3-hydroxyacyl-[acyl-carrier-protein] dehydratase n=1 Tax=Fraserbacteria sp. (strain RBG_16_55_9) TaxID=1817864 RepID=A0A1F5UNQ0_FRAXR|nr:MAG: 3-hydroxyacyl-[acyl-carrier-protein] dehydratase FabZ [Candidatus Fraserbacteria bacterium RBG_16_55_9]
MRTNNPRECEPTVLEILPLRYPYLMVDRVLEREPDRVVALKNVSQNEWFFVGHFPGRPVMPGTLLIEGMAQTAGILMHQHSNHLQAQGLLVGVDGARFRRQVVPGDQILYEAKLLKARGGLYRMEVAARVENELVAEAVLSLMSTSESSDVQTR